MARYRLTIDTGGTFCDLVLLDETTGRMRVVKSPSTPDDPSRAVFNGLSQLAEDGVDLREIALFFHGTTVATNALLEERGARVGLAVTDGFRGVYEAAEQSRPFGRTLFDLGFTKPSLLAPQSRTAEIVERVAADGSVITALDQASISAAIERFEAEGVEAVAICFLFSFMRPDHEQVVRDAIRGRHPEWWVTASSDLLPQIREYFRLSTTVINAYVSPILGRYTRRLEGHLDDLGVAPGRRFTMQSNGGSTPLDRTADQAAATILSGPAGGVTAGVAIGRDTGTPSLITFDMGGTSCDVALIQGGLPATTTRSRIGGRDIALQMLDINTVSAGGGTLAWVDAQGALHLGPESAGAVPGAVCYSRGGTIPTVTDADVVLGYLNPVALLGGALPIDAEAARRAVREKVADPLGVDLMRAADGIVKVVNVKMAEAIKAISTHRGYDLRDFALVPFGGAGPVHACQIAVDLGIAEVIVPRVPGVLSALGLMMSSVRHDHVRSRLGSLAGLDETAASAQFTALWDDGRARLREEGFGDDAMAFRFVLEMRYAGQGYELPVPVDAVPLPPGTIPALRDRFDEIHRKLHGHAAPDQPVEVVNYRVEAIGLVPQTDIPNPEPATGPVEAAIVERRPALFTSIAPEPIEVPVYERSRLAPGHAFEGPAVVEQYDATTVICPEQTVVVDEGGNLRVRLREVPA